MRDQKLGVNTTRKTKVKHKESTSSKNKKMCDLKKTSNVQEKSMYIKINKTPTEQNCLTYYDKNY